MADKNKKASVVDEITEAKNSLLIIYKSIISKRLPKVHRKMKIYPSLTVPPYQRQVKVYDSLTIPHSQDYVQIIELPDNYYPTSQTEIKHVINKERYHRVYSIVKRLLQNTIDKGGLYAELNNFEELFNALGRSPITQLYEEYFNEDDDVIAGMIYGQVLSLSEQVVIEYRIGKAFEL